MRSTTSKCQRLSVSLILRDMQRRLVSIGPYGPLALCARERHDHRHGRRSPMIGITAIIPTYNRARLISRSVDSVLAQSYPAAELLIVDDGSTDETRAVLSEYGSRVRYISQANGGVAAASNTGIQSASSDWIAFLGSDDVWTPDYLERIAAAIEATHEAAPVYFADLKMEGAAQTAWELGGFSIAGGCQFIDDASDWYMRELQPMAAQATVFRRDAIVSVGGLDESMRCCEDLYLLFLIGMAQPACAVAGVGAVVTAAAEDSRLTTIHHPETRSNCEHTIDLYRQVLSRCAPLPRRHRRVLRQRLAGGYFRRARLDWADRDVPSCVVSIVRSGVVSPRVPLSRISRWARGIRPSPPLDYVYRHPDKNRETTVRDRR